MKELLAAAAVLTRAGVVRPVGPVRLARIAAQTRRWGASPATLVGVSAVRWPDRVAIVDDGGELTYRELSERADALATHLADRYEVRPNQGVAVMCRNSRAVVEGILAAGRIGADVLMVNTELPAAQLGAILARQEPAVVLHDDDLTGRLAEAGPDLPALSLWEDGPVDLPPASTPLPRVRRPGQLVLLTSGTTGAPKGVPRTPEPLSLLGMAASAVHRLGLRTGSTMLVSPPAFHGMGLATLLLGLAMGDTVVLQRRFDAEQALAAIQRHQVTDLVAVPAMLQRLSALPGLAGRTGSLRAVLSGAAPLSPSVASAFMDVVGDVLHDGYGSSEIGIVTFATPADLRAAPGTVGRPALGASVLVLDEAGQRVPTGTVGQVFVSSPMTFDGYTGGGSKDVRHGHLASGDLGHLDARGRLFIDGRADDMIVSGGENVFPQPVEDALLGHPAIADAAVVGVPDEDFGQRLRAYVVTRDGYDEDAVRAHLRDRLARYELPRDIVVVADLPRNATGKVVKSRLTEVTR
ncbi:AMP-binding protein [Nocardioides sp. LML1-1-1.1]|uniref:AMP-binding protein n=1 Tax=Nocardioides sp. LML1-1-1.1 TaxID=3135248 RepID=UPI0034431671